MKRKEEMARSQDGPELKLNLSEEEVERLLEDPGQQQVRKLVRDLPEEAVSLVWRSELNEKIQAIALKSERKRRVAWVWRPALGLGVAGLFAVALLFHKSPAPASRPSAARPSVEAALLDAHRDDVSTGDIAGPGLNAFEVDQDVDANQTDGNTIDSSNLN